MRVFFLIAGLIILSIFHSVWGIADLSLVFVFVVAIYASTKDAVLVALLAGIITDYISGLPDGIFVLTYLSLVLLLKFASRLFSEKKESLLALAAAIVSATLLYYVLIFFLIWLFGLLGLNKTYDFGSVFKNNLWKELIINLVVFYPVYLYHKLLVKLAIKNESP